MAKVLTGWTYPTAPGALRRRNNNPQYYFGEMIPVDAEHDTSAKTIFNNVTIPAGQSAQMDLDSSAECPDVSAHHAAPSFLVSRQLGNSAPGPIPAIRGPAYIRKDRPECLRTTARCVTWR